jgi:hypothetical protein
MFQQYRSTLVGAALALQGIASLGAQEPKERESVETARSHIGVATPSFSLRWVKYVTDRDVVSSIEDGLTDALKTIGIDRPLTIELFDGAAVRGTISSDGKVMLERQGLRRLLSALEAVGCDEKTRGRVVGIYIAPTVAHELRHIDDLATLRKVLDEPKLYIGGIELEALAHRAQGIALSKLIDSGLWHEVEEAIEHIPQEYAQEIKYAAFELSDYYGHFLRKNSPLSEVLTALPTLYRNFPSIFDRGAMLNTFQHPSEDDIAQARIKHRDKKEMVEAQLLEVTATAQVVRDPVKYRILTNEIQRMVQEDEASHVLPYIHESSGTLSSDLKALNLEMQSAVYAKRFREKITPTGGIVGLVDRVARIAEREPQFLDSPSIHTFLEEFLHEIKNKLIEPPSEYKLVHSYFILSGILSVSEGERTFVLERAIDHLKIRIAKLDAAVKVVGEDKLSPDWLSMREDQQKLVKEFEELLSKLKR